MSPSRRAVLAGAVGAATVGALGGCTIGSDGKATPAMDLDDQIDSLTQSLRPNQPYRNPTTAECTKARDAVDLLMRGDTGSAATDPLGSLGFTVADVDDAKSGRRFGVAAGERGTDRSWGMVVVDRTRAPRLQIEVPHPRADQGTERIGLRLLRAIPGSVLIVAGAHRRAANELADVAHDDRSLFHTLATRTVDSDLFSLQLHGFADESLKSRDIVVSAGPGKPGPVTQRLADQLADTKLDVCRAWRDKCGPLEGTLNVQANAARDHDREFCHLEMNATTREKHTDILVAAIAATFNR